MGREKKIIPKDELQKDYWDNYLSIRKIALKYKVAKDTINKLLASYEIPVRNPSLSPVKSNRKAK
ncbi:hypothetical protein AMJ44_11080 [candidate division WOR-1 bacterium DG_54_3]|uniref:Uncharacterized protein n=1 Tax=candidate division WOR-1 bacterium DG_54_3 TaxID=1703775 RepID=A0A0S7XRM5_UNCSA|nr:MAG: hypothetical protein AMJ44_11080 [candidate division WOR-1 bacterium DG_54_3]